MSLTSSLTHRRLKRRLHALALATGILIVAGCLVWNWWSWMAAPGSPATSWGAPLPETHVLQLRGHPVMQAAFGVAPDLATRLRVEAPPSPRRLFRALRSARRTLQFRLETFAQDTAASDLHRGQALHLLNVIDRDHGRVIAGRIPEDAGYVSRVAQGILARERAWSDERALLESLLQD